MPFIDALIGPITNLIDKIIRDPKARDGAKLELVKMQGGQKMEALRTKPSRRARGPAARGQAFYMSCMQSSCGRSRCVGFLPSGLRLPPISQAE